MDLAKALKIDKLELFDMNGKLIHTSLTLDKNSEIAISHLPAGVYVAYAHIDGQVISKKFVK